MFCVSVLGLSVLVGTFTISFVAMRNGDVNHSCDFKLKISMENYPWRGVHFLCEVEKNVHKTFNIFGRSYIHSPHISYHRGSIYFAVPTSDSRIFHFHLFTFRRFKTGAQRTYGPQRFQIIYRKIEHRQSSSGNRNTNNGWRWRT